MAGTGPDGQKPMTVRQVIAEQKRQQKAAGQATKAERQKREAEARRAAREEQKREDKERAENARAVAAALRGIDTREAQRAREEERRKKEEARRADAAEHKRKIDEVEAQKNEALALTRHVEEVAAWIHHIVAERSRDLEHLRAITDAALQTLDAQGYADVVVEKVSTLNFLAHGSTPLGAGYSPYKRRLSIELDLPRQQRVPAEREFRYIAARREIVSTLRRPQEIQTLYRRLIAGFSLCVLDYVMQVTSPAAVESIALNAYVNETDKATGKKIRPLLVSLLVERGQFEELVLDAPELDPVLCLHHIKALVSEHPYDLEPVMPVVKFDLSRFRLVEETEALAGLDHRTDLMALTPYDFERLIKNLAEAMGLTSWRTQDANDEGSDAIVYDESSLAGGMCVIQAKQYTRRKALPPEAVRALYGSMEQKRAATGWLVTTTRFGAGTTNFAAEMVGRIKLIDGNTLTGLIKEHMGLDVLIGMDRPKPGANPRAE
jgi:restriction system protein